MFRWLADGGGRGEVVVAAEGVADARGGRRRMRGRRASPAGSSTFLRHCDVVGVVIISSFSFSSSSSSSFSFSIFFS